MVRCVSLDSGQINSTLEKGRRKKGKFFCKPSKVKILTACIQLQTVKIFLKIFSQLIEEFILFFSELLIVTTSKIYKPSITKLFNSKLK